MECRSQHRCCADVEALRYGVMESRCCCEDVEVLRYGAPELWRRVAGVATGRNEGMEYGIGFRTLRHVGRGKGGLICCDG